MGGLAVISTDLPFHRKIHSSYNIGFIVGQENNPREIVARVNDMVRDEEKLAKYKMNARMVAEKELNWEQQEIKLFKTYGEVMVACGKS